MSLATWWRPATKHRAVDRVRQLTAERDYLLAALTKQDGQMKIANAQILRMSQQNDDLTTENEELRDAYDELFARHQECTAISVPALADLDDTVPIPMPKFIPLSVAFALNPAAAA